jgi:hypothetical protein
MATGNQISSSNPKKEAMENAKRLLEKAERWTLVPTDKDGFIHVHADNEVPFLSLMLCVFKDRPELKDDLDMMLKLEAQREDRLEQ